MPISAKDSLSGAIDTAATAKAEGQPPQSSAAGAEVPVTVHASRYSSASKSTGKLPPVHEETSTVIIFPQGAVVRLSATVTSGELVVLTNKRTGEDVICRVTSIKTQPGIQNYVHLEFTQRALDFWQESSAAPHTELPKKPSPSTAAALPPPKPSISGPGTVQSSWQESDPVQKTQAPAIEIKSVFSSPKITSLADGPSGHADEVPKSSAPKPRVSESSATTAAVHRPATAPPFRTPQLQPFGTSIPQKSSSKTVVLFAIAAVVLLTICGVAATVLLRQDRSEILKLPNQRAAEAAESAPGPAEPASPIFKSSPATAFEPAATMPSRNSPAEIPAPQPAALRAEREGSTSAEPAKTAELSRPEVQPQPVTRSVLNLGKITAPRIKTAAQMASPEPPPALPADSNTAPSAAGENLNAAARFNPLPAPAPAEPAPIRGGQLRQPTLLASSAPVYPALARSQRVQGDVTIDALIDATGKVSDMKIVTGNALLQNAATEALRHWKYQPALLDGEPIPIHINVTITFHLK